jgi:hypothetical protein
MSNVIDVGDGHTLRRVSNKEGQLVGFIEEHPDQRDPSRPCAGSISLAGSSWAEPGRTWTLVSEDPLTLSPSLMCTACGNHGWVRDGKWVRA